MEYSDKIPWDIRKCFCGARAESGDQLESRVQGLRTSEFKSYEYERGKTWSLRPQIIRQ